MRSSVTVAKENKRKFDLPCVYVVLIFVVFFWFGLVLLLLSSFFSFYSNVSLSFDFACLS